MTIIDELKSRGFWPTDHELAVAGVKLGLSSFIPEQNSDEASGLFSALVKLTETNTRNSQLEAQAYAYFYQLIGNERFDEMYLAFADTLSSLFHRPPMGYDTFLQKVQAGLLLLMYPKLQPISDLTMLQILYRFHDKHPELAAPVCTSGTIPGDSPTDLFALSGSHGRKQLRGALRNLIPQKKKPAEDRRQMLERILGEHIESLRSLEQDIRGYGLDPALGQEVSEVVKQLFHLKDQISVIRQQLDKRARHEVHRICKVA